MERLRTSTQPWEARGKGRASRDSLVPRRKNKITKGGLRKSYLRAGKQRTQRVPKKGIGKPELLEKATKKGGKNNMTDKQVSSKFGESRVGRRPNGALRSGIFL